MSNISYLFYVRHFRVWHKNASITLMRVKICSLVTNGAGLKIQFFPSLFFHGGILMGQPSVQFVSSLRFAKLQIFIYDCNCFFGKLSCSLAWTSHCFYIMFFIVRICCNGWKSFSFWLLWHLKSKLNLDSYLDSFPLLIKDYNEMSIYKLVSVLGTGYQI